MEKDSASQEGRLHRGLWVPPLFWGGALDFRAAKMAMSIAGIPAAVHQPLFTPEEGRAGTGSRSLAPGGCRAGACLNFPSVKWGRWNAQPTSREHGAFRHRNTVEALCSPRCPKYTTHRFFSKAALSSSGFPRTQVWPCPPCSCPYTSSWSKWPLWPLLCSLPDTRNALRVASPGQG